MRAGHKKGEWDSAGGFEKKIIKKRKRTRKEGRWRVELDKCLRAMRCGRGSPIAGGGPVTTQGECLSKLEGSFSPVDASQVGLEAMSPLFLAAARESHGEVAQSQNRRKTLANSHMLCCRSPAAQSLCAERYRNARGCQMCPSLFTGGKQGGGRWGRNGVGPPQRMALDKGPGWGGLKMGAQAGCSKWLQLHSISRHRQAESRHCLLWTLRI